MSGTLAALVMIVVGCQSVTEGTASVDGGQAQQYRASVEASVEASSSRSSARESERQASITAQAVHKACDELSVTSVNAVDAVNAFVYAYNDNAGDVGAKVDPAKTALNGSADRVTAAISDPLSDDLVAAMNAWVDAARNVASLVSPDLDMDPFNAAINRLNDTKTRALQLCDAAY